MPVGNRNNAYQQQQSQQSGSGSNNGSGGGSGFSDLYRQIVNHNASSGSLDVRSNKQTATESNARQQKWTQESIQRRKQEIQQQKEQKSQEKREATKIEKFLSGLGSAAEKLTPDWSNGGKNITPFTTVMDVGSSIIQSTVTAPMMGAGSLYEAATGTDLKSLNDEDNTISNEQLSWNQRLGAGVSGAIDTVGMFAGGSGRLIGGGANAARNAVRAARGKEAAKPILEGWATKAGLGKGWQFASDTFEEGAEEFVQSIADDVRDENYDGILGRAAYAGAIGAAAGGVMSGVGLALNAGSNKIANRLSPQEAVESSQHDQTPSNTSNPAFQAYRGAEITPSGRVAIEEKQRKESSQDGSGMFRNMGSVATGMPESFTGTPNHNENALGTKTLQAMWFEDTRGDTRQDIADALHLDVETLGKMLREPNATDILNTHINNLKANGQKVTVAVGRYPATNPNVTFLQDLAGFFNGTGVKGHSDMYTYVSMDNDGDISPVFFSRDRMKDAFYPTDRLVDPSTGKSMISFDKYSGISARQSRNEIRNAIIKALGSKYGSKSTSDGQKLVFATTDAIMESFGSDGKIDDRLLAVALDNLNQRINGINESEQIDGARSGREIVSDVLYNLENNDVNMIEKIASETQRMEIGRINNIVEQSIHERGDLFWIGKGDIGTENAAPADLFYDLGMLMYSKNEKANAMFRQDGRIGLWTKQEAHYQNRVDEGMRSLFNDNAHIESAFDIMNRIAMRVHEMGGSPETAIEGLRNELIRQEVLQENVKISTRDDIDHFLEKFVDANNRTVKMVRDAKKQQTDIGEGLVSQVIVPQELSVNDKKSVYDKLLNLLLDMPINKWADVADDPRFSTGITLKSYFEERARNTRVTEQGFLQGNPAVRGLIVELGKSYARRNKAIHNAIMEYAKLDLGRTGVIGFDPKKIESNLVNGELNQADRLSMMMFVEAQNRLIPADLLVEFDERLVSPQLFIYTKYWDMMLKDSGNGHWVASAWISMAMDAKYNKVREAYKNWTENEDPDLDQRLKERYEYEVLKNIGISRLDHIICQYLMEDPSKGISLLNEVASTEWSAVDKINFMIGGEGKIGFDSTTDIIVDALTTSDQEFSVSSISTRLKESKSALRTASDMLYDNQIVAVNEWSMLFRDVYPSDLADTVIRDWASMSEEMHDSRNFGMIAYDAAGLSNKLIEKNTAIANSAIMHDSLALSINGGQVSLADEIGSIAQGIMSMDQFGNNQYHILQLMTNDDYQITVHSIDGRTVTLTRQALFESAGVKNFSGGKATGQQIEQVFTKYPAILSVIRPQKANVTYNGGDYSVTSGPYQGVKQAVAETVKNYVGTEQGEDTLLIAQFEKARRVISKNLVNNPASMGLFVRYVSSKYGGNLKKAMDPRVLASEAQKFVDRQSKIILKRLIGKQDDPNNEIAKAIRNSSYDQMLSNLASVFDSSRKLAELRMSAEARSQAALYTNSFALSYTDSIYTDFYNKKLEEYRIGYENRFKKQENDTGIDIDVSGMSDAMMQMGEAYAGVIYIGQLLDGSTSALYSPSPALVDSLDAKLESIQEIVDPATGVIYEKGTEGFNETIGKLKQELMIGSKSNFIENIASIRMDEILDDIISPVNDFEKYDYTQNESATMTVALAVKEKVDKIAAASRTKDTPSVKDIIKIMYEGPDSINNFCIKWNARWVEGKVIEVNRKTGFTTNANIINSFLSDQEDIESLLRDMRNELEDAELLPDDASVLENPYFDVEEMSYDYSDMYTETIVSRARNYVGEGRITSGIGTNGAMANTFRGFGWLSDDSYCNVEPEPVPLQQILDNVNDYEGWHYISEGTYDMNDGSMFQLGHINPETINTAGITPDENGNILVFNPDKCASGTCRCHQIGKVNGQQPGYLAFRNFLGRFNDFSQEDYMLQIKKTFASVSKIVRPARVKVDLVSNKQTAGFKGNAFATAKENLMSIRGKLTEHFTREFRRQELKNLDFTSEHARQFAQVMTPGMIVHTSDGESHVINASDILTDNEERFYNSWNNILVQPDPTNPDNLIPKVTDDGIPVEVLDIQPLMVSFEQVSNRIEQAVTTAWFESADINPKESDIKQAAWNAVLDWSDYGVDQLSVEEAMYGIRPNSYSTQNRYRTESSPTPVLNMQEVMQREMTGNGLNNIPMQRNIGNTQAATEEQAFHSDNVSRDYGSEENLLFSNDPNTPDTYHLMQTFGTDIGSETFNVMEIELRNNPKNAMHRKTAGIVIGTQREDVNDAMKWSKKYGTAIFVRTQNRSTLLYSGEFDMIGTVSIKGIDFNVFKPFDQDILDQSYREVPKSKRLVLDTNTILGRLIIQGPGKYNIADGETKISRTAASNFLYRGSDRIKINYRKALPGIGKVRIASVNEILENRDNIELLDVSSQTELAEDVIKNRIRDFYEWIESKDSNGQNVKDVDVSRGEVVTFLIQDNGGVSKIWPVFAPRSGTWEHMDTVRIDNSGSDFYFYWESMRSIADNPDEVDGYKSADGGVSDKTTTTIAEDDMFPSYGTNLANEPVRLGMISSRNTTESRLTDIDIQFTAGNMWYYTAKHGRTVFYEKDSNGNWIRKQDLIDSIKEKYPSNYEAIWNGLLSGDPATWRKYIASGDIKLVTEGPQANRQNELIADMVRTKQGRNIPWQHVFNNIHPNLGTNEASIVPIDMSWEMFLGNITKNDVYRFFNSFNDHKLCPPDAFTPVDPKSGYTFNEDGYFLVGGDVFGLGENIMYALVDWHPVVSIGKHTWSTAPGSSAAFGAQAIMRKGMELGYYNTDMRRALDASAARVNAINYARAINQYYSLTNDEEFSDGIDYWVNKSNYKDYYGYIEIDPLTILYDEQWRQSVDDVGMTFDDPSTQFEILDSKGNSVGSMRKAMDHKDVKNSVARLNRILGREIPPHTLYELYCFANGVTYIKDGKNDITIRTKQIASTIDEIARNLKKEKPIPVHASNIGRSRISNPLLRPSMVDFLFSCPGFKEKWNSQQEFVDALKEEQKIAFERVSDVKDDSRKRALKRFFDYSSMQHGGLPISDHLFGRTFMSEINEQANAFAQAISGRILTKEEQDIVESNMEKVEEERERKVRQVQKRNSNRRGEPTSPSGYVRDWFKKPTLSGFVDFTVSLSAWTRVADPMMFVANVTDKGVRQTMMSLLHRAGRNGIGPYKMSDYVMTEDTIAAIGNNKSDVDFYQKMLESIYDQSFEQMISEGATIEQIKEALDRKKDEKGFLAKWYKAYGKTFFVLGGGKFGLKQQMRFIAQEFAIRAREAGHFWWFEPKPVTDSNGDPVLDENGEPVVMDRFTYLVRNDFTSFMIEALNGPSSVLMQSAMNQARTGDLSQNTIPSMMYDAIAARMPAFKFFTSTCFSPFFRYAMNITGRFMSTFMPTSSTHYMLSKLLAKVGKEHPDSKIGGFLNDISFDANQLNASLKQAIAEDALTMTVSQLGFVIAAAAGLFQPPDDEDKMNNPLEYTFCGFRIGENWWLQDTLGMIAPFACFWSSVLNDRPRLDVLYNGIMEACYSNPVFRVSDVIGNILDPEESVFSNYEKDKYEYADAPGGAPDFATWSFINLRNFALTWSSQFYLPSFVKQYWRTKEPLEHSYKLIYEEKNGKLTEDGELGKTIHTTYEDAKLRQISRRNPVLAWMLDMTLNPATGYQVQDMPETIYYDDAQLASIEYFSLTDDEGNPLPAEEQESRILEATEILWNTPVEELEDLYRSGFYLPYATKAAISENVWDSIQALTDQYNELQQSGFFDYSNEVWGDWNEGQIMVSVVKEQYWKEVQQWKNFYNEKIRSEWISRPMQTYNRYNTTYAVDANGDVYATGYVNSIFSQYSPFVWAPGSLEDYGPTAGPENDWSSISVVTGEPLGQRALVPPINEGEQDWPDLEYWSGDGQGNGYSKRYTENGYTENGYGTKTSSEAGVGLNWTGDGGRTSSSGYYRSYGYGGSRGGGGGGGGSAPNIYSRLPNINMNSPKTMNTSRRYGPDFDYLRPGFETKGSREAYKRSDI